MQALDGNGDIAVNVVFAEFFEKVGTLHGIDNVVVQTAHGEVVARFSDPVDQLREDLFT